MVTKDQKEKKAIKENKESLDLKVKRARVVNVHKHMIYLQYFSRKLHQFHNPKVLFQVLLFNIANFTIAFN